MTAFKINLIQFGLERSFDAKRKDKTGTLLRFKPKDRVPMVGDTLEVPTAPGPGAPTVLYVVTEIVDVQDWVTAVLRPARTGE